MRKMAIDYGDARIGIALTDPLELTAYGLETIERVGYILSGDPTYITNHKNARSKIIKIERDDLLEQMIKKYLELD